MFNELNAILKQIGKVPEVQVHPDGSRLLLLPHGGRVLGLFSGASDRNFFWTQPALGGSASAAAYYQKPEWHNSGGERTWLSPEVDLFYPKYPDMSLYQVPAALDPANYSVSRAEGSVQFSSQFSLTLARSSSTVAGRITKSWMPAANPLRYEWNQLSGVDYAGYTQITTLECRGGSGQLASPAAPVGLWSLLALPFGGEVIIPTLVRAEPKVYFGPIDPANLIVTDRLVRFRAEGTGVAKIGIGASASTGRAGYIYSEGDIWTLIVRNFAVNPSGDYVDVPADGKSDADLTYVTQTCAVNNPELGAFCEVEYHVAAIRPGTESTTCTDTSQDWAFRGSRSDIDAVAKRLLAANL
jgi:hypothetical protein